MSFAAVFKHLVVWLGIGITATKRADDAACALQKPLGKTKLQDNYVKFWNPLGDLGGDSVTPLAGDSVTLAGIVGDCVQSVYFDETSYSITDGQPYEGVISNVDGCMLDVRAGRHGSSQVADDFKAGITANNALGLMTQYATLPSELNFAVFGNLSVTIDDTTRDCQEIRLAQGHHSDYNNWWLAGTNCFHHNDDDKEHFIKCQCGHSHVFFGSEVIHPHQYDNMFRVTFAL